MYNEEGPLGYWLGKAYMPLSKTKGDGYNCWRRPGGKVDRYMRFATEMGTSLIDGKPSLIMYYGAYRHRFIPEDKENTLVDEIRKLADGRVHIASKAKGMGLIDAVTTADEAVGALRKRIGRAARGNEEGKRLRNV